MKISFVLRNNKAKTPQSIRANFRVNGERFFINTHKKVEPVFWSNTKQQILSGHKYYKELNTYLKKFEDDIEKVVMDFEAKKIRLYQDKIQESIDVLYKKNDINIISDQPVVDFISFIDEHIKSKIRTSISYQKTLIQVKGLIVQAFNLGHKSVAKSGKRGKSFELVITKRLDFDFINLDFFKQFEVFLFNHKYEKTIKGKKILIHYKKNYIAKNIKLLKGIIEAAIDQGYVKHFSHKSIKHVFEEIDSVYTDFNELEKFLSLDLEGNELLTRNMYVLNCFFGFRWSDLKKIKSHFFKTINIEGTDHLIYRGRAQKTDRIVEFAVHETAKRILEFYDYELPEISEGNYNEYLKVIAYKAGLRSLERIRETRGTEKILRDVPKYELISSHTGRRSFCTNFYNAGVSIQSIMSISGHKTEREFYKYINKEGRVRLDLVAKQVGAIPTLKIVNRDLIENRVLVLSA